MVNVQRILKKTNEMPDLDWPAIMMSSSGVGSLNSLSLYAVQFSMCTSVHGELIKSPYVGYQIIGRGPNKGG
jgi:hypothetical protein